MRRIGLLVILVALAACNDPPTKDRRGYTKNILERTAPFVQGQSVTEMDRLGDPVMPETARIELRDTAVSN